MSQEGYDKLVAELRHMESVELPQVRDAIAEARDKGDLSENFEYHAAKREQSRLLGRIRFKQRILENARVIPAERLKGDTIGLLSKVEMTNLANNARMTYTIASPHEANLREGKISIKSPIAEALLNKKVGDEVDVIYTKEYGSLTYSIAINVTALQHLWTQRSSQGTQSIEISPKGVAATYNMPNIEYDHWSILNGRLLLHSPQKAGVESSGYTDTFDILMLTADTLVLGTENHQSKFWKEN